MDKLFDLLKVFLGKYFIPTIIAIPSAIIFTAKCPDLFGIKSATNLILYVSMVFCIIFLAILSLLKLLAFIKQKIAAKKQKDHAQRRQQEQLYENVQHLWDFVGQLSVPDKKALYHFLRTENKQIIKSDIDFGRSIFTIPECMSVSIAEEAQEKIPPRGTLYGHGEETGLPLEYFSISTPTKRYKLTDSFYNLLKYSQEKYDKISNFVEDNQYDNT